MSYPAWTTVTAYVAGARVTKVTDDGTNWIVETAGTSGVAEPTWPTVQPWTVTDGTVHWGLASSFRQQTVTGILAVLTAFKTANPTILAGVYAAPPKSGTVVDTPHAYIADRPEADTIAHDIRTRSLSVTVVLRDFVPDNLQAVLRMDALVDGLIDAFTLNYHAAGGYSITAQTGTASAAIPEQEVPMLTEEITVSSVITEGRT